MQVLQLETKHRDDVYAMLWDAGGSFKDAAAQVNGLDPGNAADWQGRFVAVGDRDEIVGYVAGCAVSGDHHLIDDAVRATHSGPFAVGEWIYVSSGSRKRGIGKALMRCLTKYLVGQGCAYLVVDVDSDFDDTQDFDQDDEASITSFVPNAGSTGRRDFVKALRMTKLGGTRAGGLLTAIGATLASPTSPSC